MPLIRIDVPEGTETEKKQIIHKRVREVVLRTLAPKQVSTIILYSRGLWDYWGFVIEVISTRS